MLKHSINTIHYSNGEFERYQIAYGFKWEDLEFVHPPFSRRAFDEILRSFRAHVIPKDHELYGAVIFFHVPDSYELPFSSKTIFNKTLILSERFKALKREGKLRRNGFDVAIDDDETKRVFDDLLDEAWLGLGFGDKDDVEFIPVGDTLGYLSDVQNAELKVNSHFFEMDLFDNDSPYDYLGLPFGLAVKNGVVYQPPLFGREALVVRNNKDVYITCPDISKMKIKIDGRIYEEGVNCTIFKRPECRITPSLSGVDIVVVNDRVVSIKKGGSTRIPMAGFVLNTREAESIVSPAVEYVDDELNDSIFAIQVGTSAVKDFKLMDRFSSPFFDIRVDEVPYPPTLYPLDYENARAPRMVLASDKSDNPLLIWFEGASKLGYKKGKESAGVSLSDVAAVCYKLGLKNAVNLDGGGSAEMFIDEKMELLVSSRHPDSSPSERPIPLGLIIRKC